MAKPKQRRRSARSAVRLTRRTRDESDRLLADLEAQCELLHEKLDALEASIPKWLTDVEREAPSPAPRKPR